MLDKYENKFVKIETTDDTIFTGVITDYVYPEDNENGKESMIMRDKTSDKLIEFYKKDIKHIEIGK